MRTPSEAASAAIGRRSWATAIYNYGGKKLQVALRSFCMQASNMLHEIQAKRYEMYERTAPLRDETT